jgi:hypothetical protein
MYCMHQCNGKSGAIGGLRIMEEAPPRAGVQCNQSVELLLGGCFGLAEGPPGRNCGPFPASTVTSSSRQLTMSHTRF